MPQEAEIAQAMGDWSMVWCHERCHKPDLEGFREALRAAMVDAGGNLVCLKKATGLHRRVQNLQAMPFVLLCDWREAKPCMELLADNSYGWSHLMIVYTEHMKQFKMASRWAEEQCDQHVVHVIPSTTITDELIRGVVRIMQRNLLPHGKVATINAPPGLELPSARRESPEQPDAWHSNQAMQNSAGIRHMTMPGLTESQKWQASVLNESLLAERRRAFSDGCFDKGVLRQVGQLDQSSILIQSEWEPAYVQAGPAGLPQFLGEARCWDPSLHGLGDLTNLSNADAWQADQVNLLTKLVMPLL